MSVDYEQIKANVSIGTVLRTYGFRVPVRDVYRIPCPLHGGRDANFSVSERPGLWNCFSVCQRGGSVIDLVAALDKITPKEAVIKLSQDFDLSPAQASAAVARATINKVERYNVWRDSQRPHDIQLPLSLIPLEEGYRSFTQKTITYWELSRLKYFDRGEVNPLLPPAGVFIPLHNAKGGFCSYSIRRDDGSPKYWNMKGMSGCPLFGLHKNAQHIIDTGLAIVTEGQMDCIGLYNKGIKNCVALMGSSMTETQAHQLLALTSKIVLLLDGDDAGKKASQEIAKKWNAVFDIRVINTPDNKDPDELTNEELTNLVYI